jgi:anaerobic selenocysteine-containing dehydrogenase
MTDTRIAHRICPLCEACCGLEVELDRQDKVVSIRGHDADVFSAGYICPKGVALKDLHEDPDRVRTPLVKRHGEFVEATWDEAFAEIERRLLPLRERHGKDAVAMMIGNPSAHKFGVGLYSRRLANALDTRNRYSASTLDQMPKQLSCGLMFGHWLSIPVPDIERCDFLLVLGANPLASNGSIWTVPDFRGKARAMQSRGGMLVVVDPRRTETAAVADAHHFIRPGADVFLLAAMVCTLISENLVNLGRVAEWVTGVDEVRNAVKPFTPECVSERCGIDAGTIRSITRTLAATQRAAVYGRMGTCTQPHGTAASWLIDVLNVMTGHLDVEGGVMFPKAAAFAANTAGSPGKGRGVVTGRHLSRVSAAPEVTGELPATCLAEEIEAPGESQVKALITIASNPVLSVPNGPRLAAALDTLEFMLSFDIYVNETSRHADVILPGVSPLEESHYDVGLSMLSFRNHARYSSAAVPTHQPPEWQALLRLIGVVNGHGAQADLRALDDALAADQVRKQAGPMADAVLAAVARWQGPERLLDLSLRAGPYGDRFGMKPDGLTLAKVMEAEGGIDLGPLAPRIPEVLRTPSGRIELAPPSLVADMARAAADLSRPVPDMVVIGRRQVRSNNSWMHNLPLLAKGPYRCTALVNPGDAARLGLVDGGLARIRNGERSIDAQVELSDDMMQGVISLPHGWGHALPGTRLRVAAERPGANLNAVLDDTLRDPLSGNAVLNGVAVQVEAVAVAVAVAQ